MKHIFTYLLLWIGFAYVQAAPIYEMAPPDPLPMRSMQIMTSDIRYTGVTYAPFTAALPSEQSAASESSSGRPTGSIRRGFGKPDEIGKSEEYPIGEPWILAVFAILFAGFIAWKNKTTKELHLQYQKNNSTMKNKPSIQSARNRTKVGIKSVVNATKVLSPILLFAFLTLGFGHAWASEPHFSFVTASESWSTSNISYSLVAPANETYDEYCIYLWLENGTYFAFNTQKNNGGTPGIYRPNKDNNRDIKKSTGAGTGTYDGSKAWHYTGATGLTKINAAQSESREWFPHVWIDEENLETNILSGSKIMFYFGSSYSSYWLYLKTGSGNPNAANQQYYVLADVTKSGVTTHYTVAYASADSYYISNSSTWGGRQFSSTKAASAGCLLSLGDTDYKYDGILPSFATTSKSISQGTANSGISATAGSSVVGHTQTIYYYYSTDEGSTWTKFNPASVGDFAAGVYLVRALAWDGHILVKSSNDCTLTITEPTYTVTVNNGDHGTVSPNGAQTVGATGGVEITATPTEYYAFANWSYTGGAVLSSTSTNPTTVTATAAGTVTANYKDRYCLIGAGGGIFDNWETHNGMSYSATNVVSKSVTLSANTTYTFKVYDEGDDENHWYGNGKNYTRGGSIRANSTAENTAMSSPGTDMTLTTDYAGTYTFRYNKSTKKLSIDFPEAYQIHFEIGADKGGKVTSGYPNAVQVETSTSVTSDVTWVKAGNKVTLTASQAKDYHTWYGWYSVLSPSKADPTTNRLTYSLTYTTPAITSASNKSFYAIYFENDYWISTYSENGSVTPSGGQNAWVNTPSEDFTATPSTGYKFDNWTIPANVTAASTYTSSSNPIRVNATADATLHANFSPRYAVKVKATGGSWSANDANLLTGYTKVSTKDVGYSTVSLEANTTYEVKVFDRQTNTWFGGSADQNIDYEHSGSGNEYTIATTLSGRSVYVQTAAAGIYTFNWNLTDKKIAVQYPTSWYITSGQKTEGQDDNAGGSFTALDGLNDVKGGKFVADNASVTFTATPNTGYTFDGWYTNEACTEGKTTTNPMMVSSITANQTVYAKFTPKTYTINLTQTGAKTEGSTSVTATYNAVLPDITLPTPNDGYAFMGYYSAADGGGSIFMDGLGNWAGNNSPYTDAGKKWIYDGGITLYAYFKQAEITALTLTPSVAAPGTTVTATPVIDPSPAGDTKLCWKILRSNGNLLTDDGFTSLSGNAVSFNAPTAGGTYKVACVLRTGLSCSGGTVLDSVVTDLVVASAHTVTIRYQDSEGRSLATPVEITGLPLDWSTEINPPAITGYNFTRWEAGDGIFISTNGSTKIEEGTTTTPTIYMKAQYDGTLTAVYSKKRMIYFNNTLGWSAVYVYFYENNKYWGYGTNANKGTGSNPSWRSQDNTSNPFKHKGAMTQIEGTNIWYYDCEANSVNASYTNVAFNENDQTNYDYFSATKVVRRGDYTSSLPMFVPLARQTPATYNTSAEYYDEGYWMNYPENTGYTLHIYRGTAKEVLDEIRSIAFPFTADKTMPMEVTLELNANTTYGYEIHRADGAYYGKSGTLKINASGDEGESPVKLAASTRGGIKTSAAGDYTFKLNFGESSGYGYLFGVHYPASVGSYRLVYTDNNTNLWSGNAKPSGWYHPSRVIYKNEGAADTVSFFVSKGSSPKIQIQKITSIDTEGNITWANVGSAVSYDSVSAAGVYNFITSQTASALTIAKVEPYTGNYYIRTGAVDGGWDNYRTGSDHLMTYSAFSEDRAQNTFGELFSHYKAKWCPRGTNVVFCIANDYSSCISDTLVQDVGNPYNNIYPANDPNRPGELKAESYDGTTISSSETGDKYSANIRFMWNRSTNKISRAYVSSSTNTAKKFLVLKGENTFWNSDGSILSGSGESHANKEAIFQDNENWIYEREIKVTTRTKFKLFACYAQDSPSEANAQYFRGNYAGGAWTDGNYVILINGDGTGTCNARLIYDFKTNRLIAAYLPDGSAVSGETAIHADLMVIREHQGAGQQITFNTGGSLTEVKTVYGVMRFNRWILNNRQNPEDHLKEHCETDEAIRTHHPLVDAGSMKSSDERGLYWISFPFDVNLSEVFGFGTYGVHWIIMRYNGAARAAQGYWADSEGFWEYIEDRNGVVLKGGMGYVLALDLDLMQATDRTFWSHDIQQIELFFPSTSTAGTIKQTTATVEVPAHTCTIDRTNSGGTSPDINKNRTKVDSHWNIIGVPSFANYGTTLTDEGGMVTWKDNSELNWTNDLPFLYEWNANDNTYTVQSGSSYPFKAMHAYYVQYHGTLTWSLASATTPSPIVARRTYADAPQSEEFRLEIMRNDKMEDQTFVKMSNDEEVSANFVFGEDLTKEKNTKKANIYTLVEGYIPVAGNTLPMSNQTTVVPVGVLIKSTGDYTFSIPEGTDGVGVVLVDEATGIRTSLSALDYTVTLQQGDYTNRFYLEISPIQNTPTGIDEVPSDQVPSTKVRKVMIDGVLYIVRDGKIFDARGARVE